MRVLHVSYRDNNGGAAIAASRLHSAMLAQGIDSTLFCIQRSGDMECTCSAMGSLGRALNSIKQKLSYKLMQLFKVRGSLNLFGSGVANRINKMDVDVVNLHWINCETLSISEINKIKHPIVWTLHDLWPMLGCEHYPQQNDRRYIDGYTLGIFDLDAWTWRRKRKKWSNFSPVVVCVGNWLANCAKQSILLKDKRIEVIHNTLNIEIFKPIDKEKAREILNLPQNKKLVLFGAMGGMTDARKGFDLLLCALNKLWESGDSSQIELVVFGRKEVGLEKEVPFSVHYLGQIYNDALSAVVYSAADVMCVPSRQETFGQTAAEAMACGTPVVAFNYSGLIDIIDDKVNGRLVPPYDTAEYGKAIEDVLSDNEMKLNCREKVLRICSDERVVNSYVEIYKSVI